MKLREIVSPAREIERFPCNCGSLPLNAGDLTCMVSLFVILMIMSKNCSYLVSMSDDSKENVKSSSDVDSCG